MNNNRKQARALLSRKKEIMKMIPYEAVYDDGIVKTGEGIYAKAFRIGETTYEDLKDVTNEDISHRFDLLIKEVAADFSFQFIVYNSLVAKSDFLERVAIKRRSGDGLLKETELYNRMVGENSEIGHNNVKKSKFFIVSCAADTADEAKARFMEKEDDITERFYDICKIRLFELSSVELLTILYGMYNPSPAHKR